jgi:hypothetical protein
MSTVTSPRGSADDVLSPVNASRSPSYPPRYTLVPTEPEVSGAGGDVTGGVVTTGGTTTGGTTELSVVRSTGVGVTVSGGVYVTMLDVRNAF